MMHRAWPPHLVCLSFGGSETEQFQYGLQWYRRANGLKIDAGHVLARIREEEPVGWWFESRSFYAACTDGALVRTTCTIHDSGIPQQSGERAAYTGMGYNAGATSHVAVGSSFARRCKGRQPSAAIRVSV